MRRQQIRIYGDDAELYDRVRPSYPPQLIDDVVALVGGDSWMLDAGCGTARDLAPFLTVAMTLSFSCPL